MMRLSVMLLCALLALPVTAGDLAQEAAPTRNGSTVVRSDSLEIPGLTAGCHVCEWRPKANQRPAAQECGIDDAGQARIGLFECGFSPDCERICNFVRCADL